MQQQSRYTPLVDGHHFAPQTVQHTHGQVSARFDAPA
jgi:hypothetical protein